MSEPVFEVDETGEHVTRAEEAAVSARVRSSPVSSTSNTGSLIDASPCCRW